jgi:hypothetical protein
VLTVSSTAVANGIAATCLAMRDQFGLMPHVYFDWTEGSPLVHFLRFILWVPARYCAAPSPTGPVGLTCTWAQDRPDPWPRPELQLCNSSGWPGARQDRQAELPRLGERLPEGRKPGIRMMSMPRG